jgi:predicted TIM-barrel fold metal-dependent hydrolase
MGEVKAREVGAVDMMCYLFTPGREKAAFETEADEFRIMGRTVLAYYGGREWAPATKPRPGRTPEEFVAHMDKEGIAKTLVCTNKMYSYKKRIPIGGMYYQEEEVYEAVKNHPGRLYGLAGYDPLKIMESCAKVEKAVKEYGFKGVYVHSYGYGLRPDDRKYYPLYETARSLDIPVSIQVGHSLEVMPSEVGRPIYLDEIAIDFPGLILIGSHTGWPWVDELIAMAYKHENVYMDVAAHRPKYWEPQTLKNVDGRLRTKTVWGTNGANNFLDDWDELPIRDEAKNLVLRENALRIYKITD